MAESDPELGTPDPAALNSAAAISGDANAATTGGNTAAPGLLSSADILAQGRNLALAGVPLAVGGVLESVNALRAKAVGSSAEILPSIIENLGNLRNQYSGASQAIARKLGYAGGGQVTRERQKLLGGATRQYAGLIQGAQQQGVAGLNQVESGFSPLVSGVAKEPSHSLSTSPFDSKGLADSLGGLLGGVPKLIDAGKSLFGGSDSSSLPTTNEPVSGNTYGPTTVDVGGSNVPSSETSVPVDTGGLQSFSTTY